MRTPAPIQSQILFDFEIPKSFDQPRYRSISCLVHVVARRLIRCSSGVFKHK
ncbi:hypothetical protein RchiOBHm_Chr1g0314581 [Rosa chinensis]|uniref:Uncharacterized protein n=1 Tax=Rosa chinensis TaxID=74649 RepID=A0A2P6S779_ROSCH|nr:hypothetical protein RchiOBHm_Chr1g0314581 [Rosa chinensis]